MSWIIRIYLLLGLSTIFITDIIRAQGEALEAEWPQLNRTSQRVSYVATEFDYPFEVEQTFPTVGNPSGLSYVDGTLYVGVSTDPHYLRTFDAESADELWSFLVPGSRGSVNFVPAVQDSIVLMGGQQGLGLYGLHRFTGDSLWFVPLGSLYGRNAILDNDRMYIQSDRYHCFNLQEGTSIWSRPIRESLNATPAVDETHLFHCEQDTLVRTAKLNGAISWKKALSIRDFPSLTVGDSLVFVGSRSRLYALQKKDASLQWEIDLGNNIRLLDLTASAWSLTPEMLVVKVETLSGDTMYLKSFDRASGEELWSKMLPAQSYQPPLVCGSKIIDAYRLGFLQVYDLTTGDSLYRFDLGDRVSGMELVLAGEKLFVGVTGKVLMLKSVNSSTSLVRPDPVRCRIYPNPTTGLLFVEFDLTQSSGVSLELINVLGGLEYVQDYQFEGGRGKISLPTAQLRPGTYMVKLVTTQGTQVRKIIRK